MSIFGVPASLVRLAIARRIVVYALALLVSHSFRLFDASPSAVLDPSHSWLNWFAFPLLRWDAFHFAHLAQNGPFTPMYEYEWAFFPGPPIWMQLGAAPFKLLNLYSPENSLAILLLGGSFVTAIFDIANVFVLYQLTAAVFAGMPNIASLATLLSLLSSSPAMINMAPYSEPIFAFFSCTGMLLAVKSRFLAAAFAFTVASFNRGNGVFLSGFILWGILIAPFLHLKQKPSPWAMMKAVVYGSVPFTPFVYHHLSAFAVFCHHADQDQSLFAWCSNSLPLIYPAVQEKYWNVGLFRYWTLQQLPNFIIAAPPMILLIWFSCVVLLGYLRQTHTAWTRPHLLPQALYTLFVSGILLFTSHTQIVLRLGSSMPMLYWGAAWLCMEHPKWARVWVGWSIVWGLGLSVGLWAAFLPPA